VDKCIKKCTSDYFKSILDTQDMRYYCFIGKTSIDLICMTNNLGNSCSNINDCSSLFLTCVCLTDGCLSGEESHDSDTHEERHMTL